jgi:hypothetical protein
MATRSSSRISFDHILDVVLERDDSTPLKRALLQQGYNDIHALAVLTNDVIDSLTYDNPDDEEFEVPIMKFERALISTFLDFIIHRNNINNPVGTIGPPSRKQNLMTSESTPLIWDAEGMYQLLQACRIPQSSLQHHMQ